DGVNRWTYTDLNARAETVAAGLIALGLKPGDRIVVQLPNILEFLSVAFGVFRANMVPVFTLPAHRFTEISHFARKSEAAAYITVQEHEGFDYRELADAICAEVPGIRHAIIVGDASKHTP